MTQLNYNNPTTKIQIPGQSRQMSLDEITPDFSVYPWAGIVRSMYWSYRRQHYALADLALDQFVQLAQGWQP